jgi:SAM-dependent methyltransferase
VGDVHELSRLVTGAFDAVYAISTFEHLAMPWKAILEINAVLAEGGLLFVATHQSWPPHELPWDFWRYSPAAFQALLTPHTGFEILRAESGLPAMIVPMVRDVGTRDVHRSPANLGVSVLARKVSPPRSDLRWDLTASDVLASEYPTDGSHASGAAEGGGRS